MVCQWSMSTADFWSYRNDGQWWWIVDNWWSMMVSRFMLAKNNHSNILRWQTTRWQPWPRCPKPLPLDRRRYQATVGPLEPSQMPRRQMPPVFLADQPWWSLPKHVAIYGSGWLVVLDDFGPWKFTSWNQTKWIILIVLNNECVGIKRVHLWVEVLSQPCLWPFLANHWGWCTIDGYTSNQYWQSLTVFISDKEIKKSRCTSFMDNFMSPTLHLQLLIFISLRSPNEGVHSHA